jgi:hypothetical protein
MLFKIFGSYILVVIILFMFNSISFGQNIIHIHGSRSDMGFYTYQQPHVYYMVHPSVIYNIYKQQYDLKKRERKYETRVQRREDNLEQRDRNYQRISERSGHVVVGPTRFSK